MLEKIKIFFSDKEKRASFIKILICLTLSLGIIIGCTVYVCDYYHADTSAIAEFNSGDDIEIIEMDRALAYRPENPIAGFIFYPGGKVEYIAYSPLMESLASQGILCVLVKMPLNLAVLDVNRADGIQSSFPEVTEWYIGGHSLGGSMAASYLSTHTDTVRGLVLLGSYSTADVKDSHVISIYGSEDGVMNSEKYEKYKENLPSDFRESIIDGGCHAYFGMYGEQKGDGCATISQTEQILITSEIIAEFIKSV